MPEANNEPSSPTPSPQKVPKRQRGKILQVRVSDAELAEIAEAADRVGLTLGSYARQRLLGHTPARAVRRPPVDRVMVARVLAALGPIASDVRALAGRGGDSEGGDDVGDASQKAEAALAALTEIRDLAMRALRRDP